MKNFTNKEITDKFIQMWPHTNVEIVSNDIDSVAVSISKMYDAPGLGFKQLLEVGQFFETMNVDTENDINMSGCETCDYGSSYGFTLYIKPE